MVAYIKGNICYIGSFSHCQLSSLFATKMHLISMDYATIEPLGGGKRVIGDNQLYPWMNLVRLLAKSAIKLLHELSKK
jgi:hypothetical protein